MERVRQGPPFANVAADQSIVKRFESPERSLVFEHGRLELITVGGRFPRGKRPTSYPGTSFPSPGKRTCGSWGIAPARSSI